MQRSSIASGHKVVTEAAEDMLAIGGNAFDAAVSAAFVSTIAEPLLNSLGGGGFMVAQKSQESEPFVIDFFCNFPQNACDDIVKNFEELVIQFSESQQAFHIGPASVATPGTLQGLLHIHRNYGRLLLADILAPAVELCEAGVELNETQSYVLDILSPIACHQKEGREIYAPEGEVLKCGDKIKNRDLAAYLRELPKDMGKSLYQAGNAKKWLEPWGALSSLTPEDLADYRVVRREPHEFKYRDTHVWTVPPPAQGGLSLNRLLNQLGKISLEGCGFHDSNHLASLAQVLCHSNPVKELKLEEFQKGTTHISVVDDNDNWVSLSLTNGEGSGHFVPGTGIMLNNMLGEEDICTSDVSNWKPGKRMSSMMAPLIMQAGSEKVAMGSGGSKRIRSTLMQMISHITDFGLSLEEATLAPRFNWDGENLHLEPGVLERRAKSIARTFPLKVWPAKEFYFGGAHSVAYDGQSQWIQAMGDPRRNGHGRVLEKEPKSES